MLFTSSFKLLSVAAVMLPALLVGASPHSLSKRTEPGTTRHLTLHECLPLSETTADCNVRVFDEVILQFESTEDDVDIFQVQGGWEGTPAIAKATESLIKFSGLRRNNPDFLAAGDDAGVLRGGLLLTYYVILKTDEEPNDSDGSGDTIRGR